MAIDYVLRVGCAPQEQLGIERLVELHRTRMWARAVADHAKDEGRDPAEVAIQVTLRKPDGDSARAVTLADLLAEAAPLDALVPACAACPAQLAGELACHQRIAYPIPEHAEAWLVGRLPASLGCTAGALLVRGLREFRWDGAPVAALRAQGTTYFESRAPYGVRWRGGSATGDDDVIEVSSDQLFQMMFMVGHLAPTHCLMLALFLGVIPHDTPLADLKDTAGRATALAAAVLPPEPDAATEQLASFLRALAAAARLDVPILIDG